MINHNDDDDDDEDDDEDDVKIILWLITFKITSFLLSYYNLWWVKNAYREYVYKKLKGVIEDLTTKKSFKMLNENTLKY